MLNQVDQNNKRISQGIIEDDNLRVGSLDVTNLYGSVNTTTARDIVWEKVMKSDCKWEAVDFCWALIYMKLNLKPLEWV